MQPRVAQRDGESTDEASAAEVHNSSVLAPGRTRAAKRPDSACFPRSCQSRQPGSQHARAAGAARSPERPRPPRGGCAPWAW